MYQPTENPQSTNLAVEKLTKQWATFFANQIDPTNPNKQKEFEARRAILLNKADKSQQFDANDPKTKPKKEGSIADFSAFLKGKKSCVTDKDEMNRFLDTL